MNDTLMVDHSKVNRDFFIKVYGLAGYGDRSTLKSSAKIEQVIGEELHEKHVNRAYERGVDKLVCKLRRGLTIIFYSK